MKPSLSAFRVLDPFRGYETGGYLAQLPAQNHFVYQQKVSETPFLLAINLNRSRQAKNAQNSHEVCILARAGLISVAYIPRGYQPQPQWTRQKKD